MRSYQVILIDNKDKVALSTQQKSPKIMRPGFAKEVNKYKLCNLFN